MFKLNIGCHRGTVNSRDSLVMGHDDKGSPLETLDDVKALAQSMEHNYNSVGYYLWFAHAITPTGEVIRNILPGTHYW